MHDRRHDQGRSEMQCADGSIDDHSGSRATSHFDAAAGKLSGYALPQTPVSILYRIAGREDLVFQWEGHLSRYDGIGLDPQSRTVPCRITVDDPQNFLIRGEAILERRWCCIALGSGHVCRSQNPYETKPELAIDSQASAQARQHPLEVSGGPRGSSRNGV